MGKFFATISTYFGPEMRSSDNWKYIKKRKFKEINLNLTIKKVINLLRQLLPKW
jgi:hypothetical protein